MSLLEARWVEGKFVCVGLDSDAAKIPAQHLYVPTSRYRLESLMAAQQAFREGNAKEDDFDKLTDVMMDFNHRIVRATKHLVCAYKPNSAFYEALGDMGLWVLNETITFIHEEAPEIPVILDYKRGDIGNTNAGYVAAAAAADAVTLQPYLGMEAMKPFLDQANKGCIVLARTSNEGAGELQDLTVQYSIDDGLSAPLYKVVAHRVATAWNYNSNCAVVAGATSPPELAEVRKIVGDMPILIPGIGAQGGELEATVTAGKDANGSGMIINSSRGIIFASSGEDFADVARDETQKLHEQITAALAA